MSSFTAAGRLLNLGAVAAYVYVGQVLVSMEQGWQYVERIRERRARATAYVAKHRRGFLGTRHGYLTHVG